jgi:hypothetical protein
MKWTLAVLLVVASCGGGSNPTPQERLIGKWLYSGASAGIGLEFDPNDAYSAQVLQLTSSTTGNDEVETGTFAATDTEIAFTPQKSTCPGPVSVYTLTYHFNEDSLGVLYSTGAMVFSRNTDPPSSNAIVTFGCFQSGGSFVPAPLAAVSN